MMQNLPFFSFIYSIIYCLLQGGDGFLLDRAKTDVATATGGNEDGDGDGERIQDGEEDVAASAVSDRKLAQADAICSAIRIAGDGGSSAPMSARRSLSTSSSAPRQTWCCVTCGQKSRGGR